MITYFNRGRRRKKPARRRKNQGRVQIPLKAYPAWAQYEGAYGRKSPRWGKGQTKSAVRKHVGEWLAEKGNPRRKKRRTKRRRNPYLTRLNPRRRVRRTTRKGMVRRTARRAYTTTRRRRRNPYLTRMNRHRRRRRNPNGYAKGVMGRLQALTSQKNIISGLWTLGGVSATLIIPKQLFGILPIGDDLKVTLSTGIPGVLSSLIVGSATSVAVDTWVGREAGSSFFRGVMVAGIAQLVFQLAPNMAAQLLPLERLTGVGDYYTQFGYGTPNSSMLADEANVAGVGDWMQVPEVGGPSNIAGVGDWFGTDVPVTAVGPMAAPVGENF